MRRALVSERGVRLTDTTLLHMVVYHSTVGSREVSSFRVFHPGAVQAEGLRVHRFGDLDTHPRLRLYSGHIEGDGRIVLYPLHSGGSVVRRRGARGPAGTM